MNRLLLKFSLAALCAPLAFGQWTYFLKDTTMAGPPSPNWTTSNRTGTDMLTGPLTGGEIRAVVAGNGGFGIYLAASDCNNPCQYLPYTSGYSVNFQSNGSVSLNGTWVNSGQVNGYYLSGASIPTLQPGSIVRAVARPDPVSGVDIIVYVNNSLVLFYNDTMNLGTAYGSYGFVFPGSATSYVSEGDAAVLYTGAPSAPTNVSGSGTTNQVSLQWSAATEPNGPGVYGY